MLLVDRRKKEVRNDSVALGAVGLLDALFLVRRRDRIDLGISDGVLKSKGFSARDKQALQGKSGLSF